MNHYMRCKTTLGHRYRMRRCEDEIMERRVFHAVMVILPLVTVFGLAAAAGMI